MFERFLSVFIFILYLFDTILAKPEEHNKGKDLMRKMIRPNKAESIPQVEQFVMPS